MVEDNFSEEGFEDLDEEMNETNPNKAKPQEAPVQRVENRGRPKASFQQRKEEKQIPKDRYAPFHIAERSGIVDQIEDKIVAEDLFVLLALILNKLDKIEGAVC